MDISQITDNLYLGTQPDALGYQRLHDLGVRFVINMRGEQEPPPHDQQGVASLWLPTYDTPFTPIPLDMLQRGTEAALQVMERGGKVLVHCAAGRHRSVAMTAAILIAQGYSADAAMDLIVARRPRADPRIFYIQGQIRRFERRWWRGGAPPFDRSRVRALLFDLDGTLADTDDQYLQRAAAVLGRLRFLFPRRDPRALLRPMLMAAESPLNFMLGLPDTLGLDVALERLRARAQRWRGRPSAHYFLLMPGVIEMLARVSGQYRLALVTTRNQEQAEAFLAQYDLGACFETVISAFSAPRLKPHPAPVRLAAERLALPVEACVMIGDTTVDVLAGRRAGAQAVGVLCGFGERAELQRAGANLILEHTAQVGDW